MGTVGDGRSARVLVGALSLLVAAAAVARADEPDASGLLARGKQHLSLGMDRKDAARVKAGLADLRRAKELLEAQVKGGQAGTNERARIAADLAELEDWLGWGVAALRELGGADPASSGPDPRADDPAAAAAQAAEARARDRAEQERFGPWLREVKKQVLATEDPAGRAALARKMASEARIVAVPTLMELFRAETVPEAREGIHEALASIGTSRVANEMTAFARKSAEPRWPDALDVVYRALARPEREEPEAPWCRTVRAFHRLQVRKLTLGILDRLDAMGGPGVAALGEVLYVDDFGYHAHAIARLATKRDTRAVPPLVHKMNRFENEAFEQMPAHKALLAIGWYAVPELIARLDDKAAGIWISWTLRKITGETMGTTKWKWHDWWKHESLRHPELFEDPDERPAGAVTPSEPAPR